ncbi:hypothetical protein PWT90_01415 [Aphanocladium album]|nr:hypothetical protein PWT90_01415 [Aphanocladium album]
MDPFTAVSLAGNILQFLASARSVYKQLNQIRSSVGGFTEKQEEMLSLASDLENASERIASSSRSSQAAGMTMTSTEKRIRELGDECQQLSRELQEHIRTKASKDRSSLLRASTSIIMGTWKLPEADKKLKRLMDLQKTLFKLLLAHVSDQQASFGSAMATLIEQNRRLEINRAAELKQLKAAIAGAADSFRPLLSNPPTEDVLRSTSERLLSWGQQTALLQRE